MGEAFGPDARRPCGVKESPTEGQFEGSANFVGEQQLPDYPFSINKSSVMEMLD
jgi:hypothetical protein